MDNLAAHRTKSVIIKNFTLIFLIIKGDIFSIKEF